MDNALLTVSIDLFDISKRLIVKKGAIVNFGLVHRLMAHGKESKKTFIAFGNTALFKDFKNIFKEEKYFTIFTPVGINEQISDVIKNTEITKEIFDELNNLKENLPYTFRHTLMVTALSVKIALDLKNKGYDPNSMAFVALTHDIGKSRIPKQILGKDTPLHKSEYDILKTHSLMSYLLLCWYLGNTNYELIDSVRDHHEKMNGQGYPRGATRMKKYAKIITPIDIFDALISERPYRGSSFSIRQALDYLIDESNAGTVDKEVVYHLISYVRKEHPKPEELKPGTRRVSLSRADTCYGKIIPDV